MAVEGEATQFFLHAFARNPRWSWFFPVLLLAFVSPSAFALEKESCPPIDYSAALGPARARKATEWHWAFAAADLLSFGNRLKPGQRFSAADLVGACAGMDASRTPDTLSAIQGRVAARLFREQAGKPFTEVRATTLAGIYCLADRGYACLESQVPTENFLAVKEKLGATELAERMEAACTERIYLDETRAASETFSGRAGADAPATVAAWLRLGAPVAITAGGRELVAAGLRWNAKGGACEFLLRNGEGGQSWAGEAELRKVAEQALRITTRPIVHPGVPPR